eukprot:TRINITY_DN75712_c0_g1_i1.p1 TRINITY_DN75712_c0_g1~~TRINITY_DN75712_c0_g1_i1.p1  ORF type:complete len:520 (+),score=96.31 TRINITY_DN75712_c0_g1_i1:59-1618(+)
MPCTMSTLELTTESIRDLRAYPSAPTSKRSLQGLFDEYPKRLPRGLPSFDRNAASPLTNLTRVSDNARAINTDSGYLKHIASVLRDASKQSAQGANQTAFGVLARGRVDFGRVGRILRSQSEDARNFARELGTKNMVNLLRHAREDAEATSSIRIMACAAVEVLRSDKLVSEEDRVACMANYATLYGYLRDWGMQKKLCEEVLVALTRQRPGADDDREVLRMKQHLGVACLNLGEWEEAKKITQEVMGVQVRKLGPDHIDVAWCKRHLGVSLANLGDRRSGKRLCQQALRTLIDELGSQHLEVARMRRSVAVAFGAMGDWASQQDMCKLALKTFQMELGDDHIDTAITRRHLAMAMDGLGDHEIARNLCEGALHILALHLGDEHLDVARTKQDLATICASGGDLEACRKLSSEARKVLQVQLGDDHAEVTRFDRKFASASRIWATAPWQLSLRWCCCWKRRRNGGGGSDTDSSSTKRSDKDAVVVEGDKLRTAVADPATTKARTPDGTRRRVRIFEGDE